MHYIKKHLFILVILLISNYLFSSPTAIRSIGEIEYGESLVGFLERMGIAEDIASDIVIQLTDYIDLRKIQAGEEFKFIFIDNKIKSVSYRLAFDKDLIVSIDNSENIIVEIVEKEYLKQIRFSEAVITTSLYEAGIDSGIPAAILMRFITLLGYAVDFQRDISVGDKIELCFEVYVDQNGEIVKNGEPLFGFLHLEGRGSVLDFYRYTDLSGFTEYFNAEGGAIRRQLLRSPVNGAFISSGFGMRTSPILGYSLMHKGIDFACVTGTPIMAAGSGTITMRGWSDVYGWHIKIRHPNGYDTFYAHMSSFVQGLTVGSRVSQEQIIGYVGSTGMSTGPHCHYEIIHYGTHINPSTIEYLPTKQLYGDDLLLFENQVNAYISAFY